MTPDAITTQTIRRDQARTFTLLLLIGLAVASLMDSVRSGQSYWIILALHLSGILFYGWAYNHLVSWLTMRRPRQGVF